VVFKTRIPAHSLTHAHTHTRARARPMRPGQTAAAQAAATRLPAVFLSPAPATGCGGHHAQTGEAIETPCGIAVVWNQPGVANTLAHPRVLIATNKRPEAFRHGRAPLRPAPTLPNALKAAPPAPHGVSYYSFYHVEGEEAYTKVPVGADGHELIAALGMYAFPARWEANFAEWKTSFTQACHCTGLYLFQSHP